MTIKINHSAGGGEPTWSANGRDGAFYHLTVCTDITYALAQSPTHLEVTPQRRAVLMKAISAFSDSMLAEIEHADSIDASNRKRLDAALAEVAELRRKVRDLSTPTTEGTR